MSKVRPALALAGLFLTLTAPAFAGQAHGVYVPGEVLVRSSGLSPAPTTQRAKPSSPTLADSRLREMGLLEARLIRSEGIHSKASGLSATPALNVYLLRFPADRDLPALMRDLRDVPGILHAEPNQLGRLTQSGFDVGAFCASTADYLQDIGLATPCDARAFVTRPVRVAVIDSGVDGEHEDLAGVLSPLSWNVADDDGDLFDDQNHGTLIAGLIAADPGNPIGFAGVGAGAELVSYDIVDASGHLTLARLLLALERAVADGADVINMSLSFFAPSRLLEDALTSVSESAVLVASAGNEDQGDRPVYPASFSTVIGVAATQTGSEKRALFSNYNGQDSSIVDLAAPGVGLFTTVPGSVYSGLYTTGASYSAALVSGAAALVRSKYPEQSAAGVTAHLKRTARPIGAWAGHGRLDVAAALNDPPVPDLRILSVAVLDSPALDPANDGDGAWDAGETIDLVIRLLNHGSDALELTGHLSVADPRVMIADPGIAWPRIRAGRSAEALIPVRMTAAPEAQAFRAALELELSSNGGAWQTVLPIAVQVEVAEVLLAQTHVTPQVWHATRTYEIRGTQTFRRGGLTIEPGALVKVAPGASLILSNDRLEARGTADAPIRFMPLTEPGVPPGHAGASGDLGPRTEPVDLSGYEEVHYVSVNSVPAGPRNGSREAPWETISAAVAQVRGATLPMAVLVAAGTYREEVVMDVLRLDLYGGFDPETWDRDLFAHPVVMDGERRRRHLDIRPGVQSRVDGFRFVDGQGAVVGSVIVRANAQPAFSNNIFARNLSPGGSAQAIYAIDASPSVRQCLFWRNGLSAGGSAQRGGAIAIGGSNLNSNGVIRDNVFIENRVERWGGAVIVQTETPLNSVVANNLFLDNQAAYWGSAAWIRNTLFENNTLLNNESPTLFRGTESTVYGEGQGLLRGNHLQGNVHQSAVRLVSGSAYDVQNCVIAESPGLSGAGIDAISANVRVAHSLIMGNTRGLRTTSNGLAAVNSILHDNVQDAEGPVRVSACVVGQEIPGGEGLIVQDPGLAGRLVAGVFSAAAFDPVRVQTTLTVSPLTPLAANVDLKGKVLELTGIGSDRARYYLAASNTDREVVVWGDVSRQDSAQPPYLWELNDYHLQADSPCIGAGTPISGVPFDVDGDPRPGEGGDRPDIGVDEFNPLSPVDGYTWGGLQILAGVEADLEHCLFESGAGVENYSAWTSVRHCVFQNSDGWGYYEPAGLIAAATAQVEACTAFANGQGGMHLGARAAPLTDSAAMLNNGPGLIAPALSGCYSELNLGVGMKGGTVQTSIAMGNGGGGVEAGGGVVGVRAQQNLGDGIAASGGDVRDSTAVGNRQQGIRLSGGGTVAGCLAARNEGCGIASDGAVIAGCRSEENLGSGVMGAGASTLLDSQVLRNLGAAVSGIAAVTGCAIAGNASGLVGVADLDLSYIAANQGDGVLGGAIRRSTIYGNMGAGAAEPDSLSRSWVIGNHGPGVDEPRGDVLESSVRGNAGAGIRTIRPERRVNHSNLFENGEWDYADSERGAPYRDKDLTGNYWGPASTAEMQSGPCPDVNITRILDAFDKPHPDAGEWFADYCHFLAAPLDDSPGDAAPAFVLAVTPSASEPVGHGVVPFRLTFSEAMDTSVLPVVTFDSQPPYTRFIVRFAAWADARTWRGDVAVTEGMEDGLHTIRISRARAADGFVIPDDTRHTFIIDRGALSAVNATATTLGSTRILLAWDATASRESASFEILRSLTGRSGTFHLIARDILASTYTDEGLAPNRTYWYRIGERSADLNSLPYSGVFRGETRPLTPTLSVR